MQLCPYIRSQTFKDRMMLLHQDKYNVTRFFAWFLICFSFQDNLFTFLHTLFNPKFKSLLLVDDFCTLAFLALVLRGQNGLLAVTVATCNTDSPVKHVHHDFLTRPTARGTLPRLRMRLPTRSNISNTHQVTYPLQEVHMIFRVARI